MLVALAAVKKGCFMLPAKPSDPLYYQARQHVLYSNDPGISHLQRRLRIGYQRAIALRDSLAGDAVEYRSDTDSWQIHPQADRLTDFLIEDKLAHAAQLIYNAKALVIAAGAGIGIDSGLPDYRGDEGFWRAYPMLGRQRLPFERIASPHAFRKYPATAWGFYGHRLNLYRATMPHAGFSLLQSWAQRMEQGCFVFTSNVDGHFQKAGFPSARVYECHGSIHRLQCIANCTGSTWPTVDLHPRIDEASCEWQGDLPHCPHCGELARPNILMFEDWHWNQTRSDQQQMLLDMWLDSAHAPVVIEVGAGSAIPTVRQFTRRMQQRGSRLIRINLHDANIFNPDAIEFALGAKEALQRVDQYLINAHNASGLD